MNLLLQFGIKMSRKSPFKMPSKLPIINKLKIHQLFKSLLGTLTLALGLC
jgi:hypothetical protein